MFPIQSFLERFSETLSALDALAEDCDGGAAEDLEDLNAELEDALMLLGELKAEGDPEELSDALEEIKSLAGDYRALARRVPGLSELADRLDRAADLALNNL